MKYKSIIPLVISLLLLLGACAPSHPSESSDTHTPSESIAASSTPISSEPGSVSTSVPEGTALDESELDALREFFGDANNWNSQILASGEFYGVENIDLYLFFQRGIPLGAAAQQADADEHAYYVSVTNYGEDYDIFRLPVSEMDKITREYLKLPLAELKGIGLDRFVYWEKTDCYYFKPAGTNVLLPEITGAYRQDDGSIRMYYHNQLESPTPEMVVTVLPENDTFRIISNQIVQ